MWVDYDVPNLFPTLKKFQAIFTAHFLCRVLAAIFKMADILKILKCRIAPLMVTYHYVKFYASIIIHLEIININDVPN
jgi:hypothetical protein